MIAHDLRSPLMNVIAAAELLEAERVGPVIPEQKLWLGRIRSTGRKLVDLTTDFLDFSKLEAGKIELSLAPMDLDQLVTEVVENYRAPLQNKQLNLKRAVDTMPPVYADRRRLEQVLNNLLSNAVKFTPKGGSITVRAAGARDGESGTS